jgi:YD repeat-containing protein
VTDFAGRTATLTYDSGNLETVTQPDPDAGGALAAPVWEFAYDATSHVLTEVEDPLDHGTGFTYGTHDRLTSITHADSNVWELTALQTIGLPTGTSDNELTAANPLGTVEDERYADWTFRLDRFGRNTEWNNPLSHKTLTQRNAVGLPIKLTEADLDGGGALTSPVTIFGYSSLGNLRYQKNPDNSTRVWTYSTSFNLVTSATDELNRVSEFTYDTDGNLTESIDPA